MPGKKHKRKITSEAQRGFFGAELRRRREGKKSKMKGMSTEDLEYDLHQSAGKDLPKKAGFNF